MKEPLVYLLKTLLRKSNISINEDELEFQILSHPSYPSLHAVTGVLDHFSIENYALEIPKNEETLDLLPKSFLALINGGDENGYALVSKQDSSVQLSFDSNKRKSVDVDYFLNVWSGVVVIIEGDKQEVFPVGKRVYITSNLPPASVVLLATIFFLNSPSLFQAAHFLLSLLGVAICILIVQHELGFHSKVLDKFCSEESKKTSCNAVLNSKGATLFGTFKFSDVGIVYFAASIISWFLLINGSASYNTTILITALTIPFTLYSIYYQYNVVRKWCPLCLSVVLVLWLQAVSLIFIDLKVIGTSFTQNSVLLTAFSFLVSLALWQYISLKLKKEKELKSLKVEHFRFKRSYNVFKSLISSTELINTDINIDSDLVFGSRSKEAHLKIILITNPLCGFCKEAHQLAEGIIKRKDEAVQISIRFSVSDDPQSPDRKIALRIVEIYNHEEEKICLAAIHDAYGELSPQQWLVKWEEPSQKYAETLANTKKWCKQNSINFTPEILVNGRSFPKEYNRTDLLYFIDDLLEEDAEKTRQLASEVEMVV